jgi:mRNA-degrading endonuclease toxin of MazEF toxin-antitoxin module
MAERDDTTFETCQIVFWRGYVKCAFYAVPDDGEPVGSPFFRSRERSPLQSPGALEAHRVLVQQLKAEGWEPVARGRAWYALTFRRRGWSPIDGLLEEEPTAVVAAIEAHAAARAAHEPEPATAPEPAPVTSATARKPRRPTLLATSATMIALAVAFGLTLSDTTSAQGSDPGKARPARTRHEPARHARPAVAAVPTVHRSARLAPTAIVVTGSRGDSWVEARAGSSTGKSLFAGVVAQGQTIHVTAPVVWITFGAAGNLDLRVNGRAPVPGTFNGTVTALIAHGRVRSP